MKLKEIKKDDIVWVNEYTAKGDELKHKWIGRAIMIKRQWIDVKNISDESHQGQISSCFIGNLELVK